MADDPLIGRQLANYRLERVLGRGGMAQVYYGWDVALHRPVAVKVIDARYRDDPAYAQRFVQEARALAAWRHENIIQVYYAGDEGGLYYHAMEYIDGSDLAQLLADYAADHERMPQVDVLRIGRAIAAALDFAHQRGVIHRDVKPGNVMVARDGRVVLGDFGLALDVQQGSLGEVFGSPHYMAPEQARRSADAVPQSDLYALGVILYEMLTGVVPFDDPSPTTVALQHLTLPPTPPRSLNPRLSPEVEGVLLKALAKRPELRYATGQALMAALEAALRAPVETPVPVDELAARPESHLSLDARVAAAPPRDLAGAAASPWPADAQAVTDRPLPAGRRQPAPRPTQPRPGPLARRLRSRRLAWGLAALLLVFALGALGVSLASRASVLPGPTPPPSAAPAGEPFALFYDANSFYLLNLSQRQGPVAPLAFERLDDQGQGHDRFDGSRWAEFYPTTKPGWCMRIEILESPPYLQPPECVQGYLSTRTPVRGDDTVFWTPAAGSQQFRVLWNESEVGRCLIEAGLCRVYLPLGTEAESR